MGGGEGVIALIDSYFSFLGAYFRDLGGLFGSWIGVLDDWMKNGGIHILGYTHIDGH